MRLLKSSVFCGKEEIPLVLTLTLSTFKTFYMHKNIEITLKERGENKIVKKYDLY